MELLFYSSLYMLNNAKCGWFWDHATMLWHVKIDFTGIKDMEAKAFSIG